MRRGPGLCLLLCLLSAILAAEPAVWTPADDALPTSSRRLTETPLGRFEAIAVGSFPIALFYVGFGFDAVAYVKSGFDSTYAPWPFKDSRAPAPSQAELGSRLLGAALFSLGVAGLDLALRPLAEARKRAQRSETVFPRPPGGTAAPSASGSASAPEAPGSTGAATAPGAVPAPAPQLDMESAAP